MRIMSTVAGFFAGYAVGNRRRNRRDPSMPLIPPVDTRRVSEIMTPHPETIGWDNTLSEAATIMAAKEIGDVIVLDPDSQDVAGILTDRDIVIRAIAEGLDPSSTTISRAFTASPTVAAPNDLVQEASFLMRQGEIRRLPVVEDGRAIGIVTLGDLAFETEPGTILSSLSEAPPDH